MYNIIVVDDEPWIIKWMNSLSCWEKEGFRIIASATEPEAVLRLVSKYKPHAVITDICMSGKNGLELTEQIHRVLPECEIVLMTAFNDVSYAIQAVHLHVFDYLTKPVSEEKMLLLLQSLKKTLSEKERQRKVANKFTYAHALQKAVFGTPDKLTHELLAELLHDHQAALGIIQGKVPDIVIEDLFTGTDREMNTVSIFSRVTTERVIFIVSAAKPIRLNTVLLSRSMETWAGKNHVCVAFGSPFSGSRPLERIYAQAEIALESPFLGCGSAGSCLFVYQSGESESQRILHMIPLLDTPEKAGGFLNGLAERIRGAGINTEQCYQIFLRATLQLSALTGVSSDFDWEGRQDFISAVGSLEEMIHFLKSQLMTTESAESLRQTDIIADIIRDINENYEKPLQLSHYAQQFFFNYNYMSMLFKKNTGKSFIAYLIETRIRKAQELIRQTDLPIHEISRLVGYEDYHYFSRLFKKHTGIAPSSYPETVGKEEP